MPQNIQAGSLVKWEPASINKIFCNKTNRITKESLPILGMIKDINGEIGRMSYLRPNGQKAEMTVLISELKAAGVPCAE